MMKYSWGSAEAKKLNREIFEHMYYAAVEESCSIAQTDGSYDTYWGSPASKMTLQPDLWGVTPLTEENGTLNWKLLRGMCHNGMRNSLLIAPMPTASTSQILGNNECFEPFTSNLYTRRVLAGDFMVINKYLVDDLIRIKYWNADVRSQIMANNGSIQDIKEIPEEIRELYKTGWEIPQKVLIDMARDRAPFICQSQSLNLFLVEPTYAKISSMHVYAWKQGLKTGCYYLRTKAAASAQKFTVEPTCQSCSA
jgi:ribonucleoside-diphosphate reductase alpha chain